MIVIVTTPNRINNNNILTNKTKIMENVQVLLEIISELRAENKVKLSDKEKGEASHFGTRLIAS
jgi:hypothetical protein